MSLSIGVDLTDPTPPYEQLRRQLSAMIGSGELALGDRLPPLRQLAGDLGLAVGTVAGLRTGSPLTFTLLSVASFPVEAAAAYFLWHQDTSTYLRRAAED